MSKFALCYEKDGLIWCQHFNGSWAPPFPATRSKKEKPPVKETDLEDKPSTS